MKKSYFLLTLFLLIAVWFLLSLTLIDRPVYKNPAAGIDERVEDLLSRMTLEEKFWQLYMIPGDLKLAKEKLKHGIFGLQISKIGSSKNAANQFLDSSAGAEAEATAIEINKIQKYFVEETRLGIPIIPFDEALHGLIRRGATSFPQSIALAATWDTLLMRNVSTAIAKETRSRGIRQVLSPVINIARDVRWGRVEETYGEDPFLTSQMAMVFTSSFERNGIITTPKHFVANVGDGGRDSYPIHFNERLLEEIYFPAFKACFQKSGSQSVMTAYNSLDGRPCTANNWLLNKKLKGEWGFKGFVISDAGATGGANVLHFTGHNYAESTKQALENGLDVILQSSYEHYPLFFEAFEKAMIDEEIINNAVRRVLRAKFKLGLFENPYVDPAMAKKWNGNENHKKLALKAARESIVLLKNDNILPLSKDLKSIAVIGEDAEKARLGGYSGTGNQPVNILQGLKNKLGTNCKINYEKVCGRKQEEYAVIDKSAFFHREDDMILRGLKGEYYNNINLSGKPDLVRIDKNINFRWTLYSPDKDKIAYDNYSVRWTGTLNSKETGIFEIGIEGDDGYRLYIDDKLFIDNWKKQTVQRITKPFYFEKNKNYDIKLEFYETVGNVRLKMIWNQGIKRDWQQEIQKAVNTVRNSDLAIVVVGIDEGEFQDRASLDLPGHQEQLILDIAKTGKPVIVLLVGGSAVTMEKWRKKVNAIIDVWYPGEQGGNAVVDILFGDCNPSGKLPITFPKFVGQVPLYYNHKPTGRGDDYIDMTGKPLYPFGFGLSYTRFEYSDIKIKDPVLKTGDSTGIVFELKNTGDYDGAEIVELYIKDLYASVARPVMELKSFKRVFLKKGESKTVHFDIVPAMFEMLDAGMNQVIEPGGFRIMIGASSNDIRLKAEVFVEE